MPSVTEIQLNKVRPLFPVRFAPMKLRPAQCMGRRLLYHWLESSGKKLSARSLFNCISVMDGININKEHKSIGIGPLYLQTEFEAN